jgi:hypothetical protein
VKTPTPAFVVAAFVWSTVPSARVIVTVAESGDGIGGDAVDRIGEADQWSGIELDCVQGFS